MSAGIECLLVDARAIALGSTCASTSLLQYELDVPLHQLKKMVGDRKAIRAYQLCGEAVDKLVELMEHLGFSQFDHRRSLYFSRRKRQETFIRKEWLARKHAGFEVEFLDQKQLNDAYGLKAAYGILSKKGATNNAYAFTHHILQHCVDKGCRVFERTKITHVNHDKDHMTLKTEEGFMIKADYVINATGYEVTRFIDKKIVDLDCTYAAISQAAPEDMQAWERKIMMWNTDKPYMYLCPADQNRIVVGGRDEPFVNIKTMHSYLPKKEAQLEKDFQKFFPSIAFKKEFSWSGVFGTTRDSLPFIGNYFKTPRTFYALGFGGNGITFSMVAAEIIRDLLLGRKNEDAKIFSFAR